MKKLQLTSKTTRKPKRINLRGNVVYFSGFCATDNVNFALFEVPKQFLVDKGFDDVLDFNLTENDLWMLIDKDREVKPMIGNVSVNFVGCGEVSRTHFDLLFALNPQCKYYPVVEWFGKASNRLIVGLHNDSGKPVGILKTVT